MHGCFCACSTSPSMKIECAVNLTWLLGAIPRAAATSSLTFSTRQSPSIAASSLADGSRQAPARALAKSQLPIQDAPLAANRRQPQLGCGLAFRSELVPFIAAGSEGPQLWA